MSEEKKSRIKNPYAGMSDKEINDKISSVNCLINTYKMRIRTCQEEIVKKQKEIEASKQEIENYKKQLAVIKAAKKYTDRIEKVRIIVVYKNYVCIDKDPSRDKGYYFQSMTKDLVLYNFAVIEANKDDYNKANNKIYDSCNNRTLKIDNVFGLDNKCGYLNNNRKKMQEDIVKAIKTFDVVDVVFNDDVTLGKALIEKELGKEVIVRA